MCVCVHVHVFVQLYEEGREIISEGVRGAEDKRIVL